MQLSKSNLLRTITTLGATLGLAGAIGLSATGNANAGNLGIDLYLGNGAGIYYSGNRNHRHGYNNPRHYRQDYYRRDNYRHKPRRRVCSPRRAVKKAYRLGLNNPQVHRIKDRRIVISGYQYGYRKKMVFKRHSRCHLLKTVNFNW
ncbi:MAG: hypothetical protein GY742_19360 [Hyphomicrobiales bacterium]|nr:hypothetical protein [Hyphomicrobiales bacterium]